MENKEVRKKLTKTKKILNPDLTLEEKTRYVNRFEYNKDTDKPYEATLINSEYYLREDIEPLTIEDINTLLGKKKARSVSLQAKERALEFINKILTEPEYKYIASYFRESLLDIYSTTYGHNTENTQVRTTLLEYAKAVLFNTYKTLGYSNVKAYCRVFPERLMRLEQEGKTQEDLRGYVSVYCKSRAVIDVETKRLLPVHIVFHDLFYNAIKTTADIMNDSDVSPKVRVEAANVILNYTKQPEIQKNQLQITIQDTDEITQLKEALNELSRTQRDKIIEGEATVVDVIDAKIYEPEKEEEDLYLPEPEKME